MSSWGFYAPPDDPARRVLWVLPLAVALVLLAMFGVGRLLRLATRRPRAPAPVEARIYELPAQKGSRPAPGAHRSAPARAQRAAPAPPHAAAAAPRHPAAPAPSARIAATPARPKAPTTAQLAVPRPRTHRRSTHRLRVPPARVREPRRRAAARTAPPRPVPPPAAAPPVPKLDLGRLGQQIDEAVASTLSDSQFANVHDPHTLVAHYYLAAVLRKLHRVGEMTYLGDQVGQSAVLIVIGAEGELDALQLYSSSGDPKLDDYALRIVHLAAPFPPFPVALERRTQQLKLLVQMNFEGYREVQAY